MANETIVQQGRFTSTGENTFLQLRGDVDWIRVYNTTVMDAAGGGDLAEAYWQRGMDTGFGYVKEATIGALVPDALTTGFTLFDSSDQSPNVLNTTVTAVSTAATPLVSAASTAGLQDGDIVRMINVTGAQQLGGIEFTIGNLVANTEFELSYMSTLGGAGTTGSFRRIPYDPIYYPSFRYITAITQAANAVITLSVDHNYTVGQEVRVTVPDVYGMSEISGYRFTIVDIDTTNNTITIDCNTSAFTAFAFPATAAVPFSPAIVTPVGETAAGAYANLLDDATENISTIGIELAAGALEPAGQANDVIYWVAGKSFDIIDDL